MDRAGMDVMVVVEHQREALRQPGKVSQEHLRQIVRRRQVDAVQAGGDIRARGGQRAFDRGDQIGNEGEEIVVAFVDRASGARCICLRRRLEPTDSRRGLAIAGRRSSPHRVQPRFWRSRPGAWHTEPGASV